MLKNNNNKKAQLVHWLGTVKWLETIDISRLDWAYKSSTCYVMYRRQRRHLPKYSILWWWNLGILLGPLHRSSPFIEELRCQAIQIEHGLI
jgi:hypothetical protein